MSTYREFRGTATSLRSDNGWMIGRYHGTDVIRWNDSVIILDSGGYQTTTTKRRMNAASIQFGLGFIVFQKDFQWFVSVGDRDLEFSDGMEIKRA